MDKNSNRLVTQLTNRTDFKHYIMNKTFVVVKISATWCGPCKRATPYFNEGFLSLSRNVNLVLIDADDGADVCSALKVKSVPMYMFYKNGDCLEICISAEKKEIEYFFKQVKTHLKN